MTDLMTKVVNNYKNAYKDTYGKEPKIEPGDKQGLFIVEGNPMTTSAIKTATERLRKSEVDTSKLFTRASETDDERKELINAIDSGNRGNLKIGKVLHKRISRGSNISHLETWLRNHGRKLPDASARTKFVKAYEAWVLNAGVDMDKTYTHESFTDDAGNPLAMTLTGVSTYALYEARNLVNKENKEELLAFVYNSTIDEIKDAASTPNKNREPQEELRSLPRIPKATHDKFKELEAAAFEGKSRQEVIAFMLEFLSDLWEMKPSLIEKAIKAYFGEEENA